MISVTFRLTTLSKMVSLPKLTVSSSISTRHFKGRSPLVLVLKPLRTYNMNINFASYSIYTPFILGIFDK